MSKVDAQRAMREAKYARLKASGPSRREAAATAEGRPADERPPAAPASTPASARKVTASPAASAGELCGHKSMNGRACTREAGHSEKNHRYG